MQSLQPNDDKLAEEHAAAFLLMAALSLAAGCLVYLLILRLAVPDQVARMAGPAMLILVSAFALYCHRRRWIHTGLLALGVGIWLEITLMAVITGGMKAPAIYLYPLIILMAGWLLGLRMAMGFAFMSVLACVILTLAESAGLIEPVPNRSLLLLVIQTGVLIFTAVIVSRIVGSYQERLLEVKRLSNELGEQVSALASSEASYRGLFNSVNEAIYIQDRQGRFLDVNEGAVSMYGHPRERFIGQTPEFVSAPGMNDLAKVGALVERAFAGEPQRFEFWGLRAAGEAFPKDVRLVRGTWYGQDVVIATAEDITERKRAEAELRRSEDKFHKVFRASPVAIAITNLSDGRYLDMNDAFVNLFGWSREEAIGRTSVELGKWLSIEDRQAWAGELERHGRVSNYERPLRNKRGDTLHVLFSAEIIDLGGQNCALVLAIDQTERKQAEIALRESQARLAEAQHIGRVGSWELGLDSERFTWSDEIYRIAERTPDDFGDRFEDVLALVLPEDVSGIREAYGEIARTDRHHEHKYRIRMPDGRVKAIHARWDLFFDAEGKPIRVLGTAQDITEQEEAKAEIQKLNAILEQRVRERTAELSSANRELESFAYSISHDLRAPLRGIDGFSHMLADEYSERLDEAGRSYIERVRKAVQRMGTLIDDILDLSRVTRQEMRRVRIDLSRMAAELIEEMSRSRPGHRVEVTLEPDCKAYGDPQLLRLMLQNLLENAWKYSSKNASARIEFGAEPIDGKQVFFVRDNGVGFDMKYAGRLFAPFQRLHKPEEFEGSGIGLATVARIVNRHGGRVWAESKPGEGTTFRFTLP